jgi:hypothetical protein
MIIRFKKFNEKLDLVKDVDKLLEISKCKAFYIIFNNKTKQEISIPLDYCSGEYAALLKGYSVKPYKKSNLIPITEKNALMLIVDWDYSYEIKSDLADEKRKILIIQYDLPDKLPEMKENLLNESDTQTYRKLQFIREQIRNITKTIREVDWKKTTDGEKSDISDSLENLVSLVKNKAK